MSTGRKIALCLLEIGLGFVTGFTWGSVGSVICVFGMLLVPCVYLWQKYLNSDRDTDFSDDRNG